MPTTAAIFTEHHRHLQLPTVHSYDDLEGLLIILLEDWQIDLLCSYCAADENIEDSDDVGGQLDQRCHMQQSS